MSANKATIDTKKLEFANEISGTVYSLLIESFANGDKNHYIEMTQKIAEYLFAYYFDTMGEVQSESDILSYNEFLKSKRKDTLVIKNEVFQISLDDANFLLELSERKGFSRTAQETRKALFVLYKILKNCFEYEKHQNVTISFDDFLVAVDAESLKEDTPSNTLKPTSVETKDEPNKETNHIQINKTCSFDFDLLFESEDEEAIKQINVFTEEHNRKHLIDYLDSINKQPDAKEKELHFLRFLVKAYRDTEYSRVLEQILLFACFARCNNPSKGEYNSRFDSDYNIRESSGAIKICPHIKHIDTSVLDFSVFRVPSELIDENVQPKHYDLEFQLNQVEAKYNSINIKSKAKWILKVILSLCIPIGIVMIVTGSNMLRPSGEPVSVGGNLLIIFGIPTVLVGIASLIMAIGFYTSVKYKHDGHDFLTKDGLCYKVLSMKMSIVYGIDPETKLEFTKDRYSEPFNCKFAKVKGSK